MERLSGLDASFLYAETDTMLMHVAFIAICDSTQTPGGYSFLDVYKLLDIKSQQEPAFRRRLVEIPYGLHHPLWVDDPDFLLTDHVHQYTLPKDSGMEELGYKIGRIMSRPLERSKPLWEAWVLEGLKDNRFALVLKIHHSMVDGVSGTDLFKHLFTDTPDAQLPDLKLRSKGEKIPTDAELIVYAMRSKLKSPGKFFQLMGDSATGLKSIFFNSKKKADKLLKKGNGKKDKSKNLTAERSRPLDAPRTHFNYRISANRNVALEQLPLSAIKAIKNKTNTTVNDVILTICGGAIRNYLLQHDDLPEKSLIAMVPISVRKPSSSIVTNNQVSGMWSTLATHVEDPLKRLALIHDDTKDAKQEHDAVGADLLQDWAEFNTPGAFNLAMRFYASTLVDWVMPIHNTIISNVPGPRETLYLAGSEIECLCPIGPVLEGVGLNISLASYKDCVGFTIHVDHNLISNVTEIGAYIQSAFEELVERLDIEIKPLPAVQSKKPIKLDAMG